MNSSTSHPQNNNLDYEQKQQECKFQIYTIRDIVRKIANNEILLPAIQRKFTWSEEQIEMLFDSIMCGYPINTFMFWHVKDDNIKDTFKFYIFLKDYIEDFQDENTLLDTSSLKDFDAVIDGQQRLTSLFIALKGSYSSKKRKKMTLKIGDNYPQKNLYLNLFYKKDITKSEQDNDEDMFYEFKFLENEKACDKDHLWFKVSDIFRIHKEIDIEKYLKNHELSGDLATHAQNILKRLHYIIYNKKLINAYQINETDFSKALKIFIRLNSGGTPLTTSNLLMSITTANWKKDAREEISTLIDDIYNQNSTFLLTQDFILKTCLYLTDNSFKFKLENFTNDRIKKIEDNFKNIAQCIKNAFKLFFELGFSGETFAAKNAALPVILWLYINNNTISVEDKKAIKQWLSLSFIKRVFGGQSDNVLKKMQDIIKDERFPAKEIYSKFREDTKHNYNIDENIIDSLLKKTKGSDTFYILNLLYPDIQSDGSRLEQDHLHPERRCKEKDNDKSSSWNCIVNLQLLKQSDNASKNDTSLQDWIKNKIKNKVLTLNEVSNFLLIENKKFKYEEELLNYLSFDNREQFFDDRKKCIKDKIRKLVGNNAKIDSDGIQDKKDE